MSLGLIAVEGYKSIKNRVELDMRPLTLLAGANSSGKSSAMQPLLLLKQTYEVGYDPGPLLINGPNVAFSQAEQMFWRAPSGDEAKQFTVELASASGRGVELVFTKEPQGRVPLSLEKCTWKTKDDAFSLYEDMSPSELETALPKHLRERPEGLSRAFPDAATTMEVSRFRSVFGVELRIADGDDVVMLPLIPALGWNGWSIDRMVKHVIHVPGLRGNPERTYAVSAVGPQFPGHFHQYAASIIAQWAEESKDILQRLWDGLRSLGLTWKVEAKRTSDTEVEIRVGRLTGGRRGGARDVVNVADVGFGLVQVLPVVVSLLVAQPPHIVYLEQPEIHLHPHAQLKLAELIAETVRSGVQVIVETHSELLLLGSQTLVANGGLPPEHVALYWFSRDKLGITHVALAQLDSQGTYGEWPADFADTSMRAMSAYLDASRPEGA